MEVMSKHFNYLVMWDDFQNRYVMHWVACALVSWVLASSTNHYCIENHVQTIVLSNIHIPINDFVVVNGKHLRN